MIHILDLLGQGDPVHDAPGTEAKYCIHNYKYPHLLLQRHICVLVYPGQQHTRHHFRNVCMHAGFSSVL